MPTDLERQLLVSNVEKDEELRMLRKQLAEMKTQEQRPRSARNRTNRSPSPHQAPQSVLLRAFHIAPVEAHRDPRPPPLEGHTTVAADGRMVVFGGRNGASVFGETWALNIGKGRWAHVGVTGNAPWGRYGHSAVVHRGCMFIFGGFGPGGIRIGATHDDHSGAAGNRSNAGLLGSLFALDLQTKCWSELSTENPEPSKSHTAVVLDGCMYVFGGCVSKGRTNAVRAIVLGESRWLPNERLNAQLIAQPTGANAALLARSDIPAARSGHCAGVHYRAAAPASMVVFGGRLSKYAFANDAFEYNLETCRWMRLYCGGAIPAPRSDHSGAVYKENLIVYGGYALEQQGAYPADAAPAADKAATSRKTFFNDIYALNLVSCTWTKMELTGIQRPLGLCGHTATLYSDDHVRMLLVGGFGCVGAGTGVHEEDAVRATSALGGETFTAFNDAWAVAIAKPPVVAAQGGSLSPSAPRTLRPHSATTRAQQLREEHVNRSQSSPRAAAATTADDAQSKPKSFSVQTCKASTAKLFGEPNFTPVPPPPKRSQFEIDQINKRLAHDDVLKQQSRREELRRKFIKTEEPKKLNNDEQTESVDRLYYQQNEWRQEKAKRLEDKWVPTRVAKKVDWDAVHETVARLTTAPEEAAPVPVEPRKVSRDQLDSHVQRLYYDARVETKRHQETLQSKYWGGGTSKKLTTNDMSGLVERLHAAGGAQSSRPASASPRRR
jgi:N-acetylneuraminic acid mutarotase